MDELKNLTEVEKLALDLEGEIEYYASYVIDGYSEVNFEHEKTARNLLKRGIGDKKQAQLDILKKLEDMMEETVSVSTSEGFEQVREFIKQLKEE